MKNISSIEELINALKMAKDDKPARLTIVSKDEDQKNTMEAFIELVGGSKRFANRVIQAKNIELMDTYVKAHEKELTNA